MKTLTVTTPYMTGADVKAAQKAMKKNKYGSFYRGDIDGEFGPLSATASKDTKFWIGFESANVKPGYGEALHEFLKGEVELSDAMAKRRKSRLARPPEKMLREKALEIAVAQIGIKESPAGSNRVKYSQWYGMTGPWCAMFVTWCSIEAGLTAFERHARWAYCPYMVSDALAGRNGLRSRGKSEAPQPGDIVLYDWQGGGSGGVADHVGFFERGSRSSFTAIEGNTSTSNDSNGGQVMRRQRDGSQVCIFAYAVR